MKLSCDENKICLFLNEKPENQGRRSIRPTSKKAENKSRDVTEMAAYIHQTASMNGNHVNFGFGENDNNDDPFEAATLQDEVRIYVMNNFGCYKMAHHKNNEV